MLTASRLQTYSFAIAAIYLVFFVSVYRAGVWIVDGNGMPIYTDFACAWAATMQALHGDPSILYNPTEFVKVQAALVAPADYYYPNWPYPPLFFYSWLHLRCCNIFTGSLHGTSRLCSAA